VKGEKNLYRCYVCGGWIVTIDKDEGVTPFMIDCKAKPGCDGPMESTFYRCNQGLIAQYEWYRPGWLRQVFFNRQTKEHVKKGGLILRRKWL
jgi:hypothetical protein